MKNYIFSVLMTLFAGIVFFSCQNDEPAQSNEYPNGPDYAAMDSRGVEAILSFDAPFMDAVVEYWDKNEINTGVVSPLSAAYIAALMANTANETTRQEILEMFGLGSSDLTMLNTTMSDIMSSINHKMAGSQISIANSIWAHNDNDVTLHFNQRCAADVEKYYKAYVGYANLYEGCDSVLYPINKWASDVIGKRSAVFFPLDTASVVIFANVLDFSAQWKKKFDKTQTQEGNFYNFDLSTTPVDFMCGNQYIKYCQIDEGEIISMDYDNQNIQLKIYLPTKNRTFKTDYRIFDNSADREYLTGESELVVPKLSFDIFCDIKDIFANMGLESAFSCVEKFSNEFETPIPLKVINKEIAINQHIEMSIDEDGATMLVESGTFKPITSDVHSVPSQIVINRPFFFEIVAYNQIIAAGRVMGM